LVGWQVTRIVGPPGSSTSRLLKKLFGGAAGV
jgi:hypothetical protein